MPDQAPLDPVADQPDPQANNPAEKGGISSLKPIPTASDESPDRDTQAWEGSEPGDAVGLVDPRHEIPNPPGL